MWGRKRGDEPAPAYEPLPAGTVRDPEAMEDTAPEPGQDGDDQYW